MLILLIYCVCSNIFQKDIRLTHIVDTCDFTYSLIFRNAYTVYLKFYFFFKCFVSVFLEGWGGLINGANPMWPPFAFPCLISKIMWLVYHCTIIVFMHITFIWLRLRWSCVALSWVFNTDNLQVEQMSIGRLTNMAFMLPSSSKLRFV